MIGLILAAGKGTRIKEICGDKNKCVLPIEGVPIIVQTVNNLIRCKIINKLLIVINSKEKDIQKLLEAYKDQVEIEYIVQQEAKGILAAINLCYEKIKDHDVFLCLGDEYFREPNYEKMIEKYYQEHYDIVLGTLHTDKEEVIKNNYAVIHDEIGNILNLIEKPEHVENDLVGTGSIIFKGEIFARIKDVSINPKRKEPDLVGLILLAIKEKNRVTNYDLACSYANINSKQQLLECYNQVGFYPKDENIVCLFKKQVANCRNQIAVICESKKLTYLELDELSDKMAYNLRRTIGAKEGIIAILLPRSVEYIVSILGVLKAGYTYIPLDSIYPAERIEYMLNNAHADAYITNNTLIGIAPQKAQEWLYDTLIENDENIEGEIAYIKSTTRAYIMYTSGSTGKPKGAQITHQNILNMVWGLKKEIYDLYTEEKLQIGVIAAFVFDMSAQQIYPSLLFGHTLHILPEGWNKDAEKVLEFFMESRIDISDGTPILLNMINSVLIKQKTRCVLRHFVVGGEALPSKSVATYLNHHSLGRITNIYGPTECCVEATTYYLDRQIIEREPQVFIGKPMNNIRIYILNENQEMVKVDECGEIYIAGDCVGLGYINNPFLTEEAFQSDILDREHLMYKTGDLGKWGQDGNIVYIGRKDKQVKIRGYRVELGEIEEALEQLPYIEGAKVLVKQSEDNNIIVAYIQINSKDISAIKISKELSTFLPHYMIPAFYIPVESFPKNINGKIDIEKLEAYEMNFLRGDEKESAKDEIEQFILDSVQEILNIREAQPVETFSILGGDSLSLIKLMEKIEQKWQLGLTVLSFKVDMNLKNIADVIREAHKKSSVIEVKRRNRKVRCLIFQEYLLNLEQKLKNTNYKNQMNIMRYLIPLNQTLDYEKFKQVFQDTVNNNDAFKIKFSFRGEKSWASLGDKVKFCGSVKDLEHLDLEELADTQSLVNIRNEVLVEYQILRTDNQEFLILNIHHVVFDYLSFHLFMNELEIRYLKGTYPKRVGNPFIEYMDEQSKMLDKSKSVEWQCENYINQISLALYPTSCNKVEAIKTGRGYNQLISTIEGKEIRQVKVFCKENNISEHIIYLSVFLRYLAHKVMQETLTIGLFMDGRGKLKRVNTIGFFTNFIYYNFQVKEETLLETVLKVKNDIDDMKKHSDIYDVVTLRRYEKDIPIVYMVFDYQKLMNSSREQGKIWDFSYSLEREQIEYLFVLRVFDYGEKCILNLKYATDVYLKQEMQECLQEYISELKNL